MEWTPHIATILVALIAALSAFATQRQSAKANRRTQELASRSAREDEAYERARDFDSETMIRQKKRIDELEVENEELKADKKALKAEKRELETSLEECKTGLANAQDS